MDLSDLHIFRSVVEEGGVTRAAEKLNRVQSNVTTRVRQLEDELGVTLFIREGKRLILAPAGKVLLDYAERLLDLAKEAREAVHDGKPRGPLRLGAMESTAAVRLPQPLKEFSARYPDVRLELRTGDTQELPHLVLSGALDAALVAEPVPDTPFEKVKIYDEELVLVAGPDHAPLRGPRDARTQAILAFHPGCPYRMRLEQWFSKAGEIPERIIEMTSWHAILGCTAAGMGISLLPRMVLTTMPNQEFISVHKLPADLAHAPTMLIWRKGARSPKINALLDVLQEPHGAQPGKKRRAAGASRAPRLQVGN